MSNRYREKAKESAALLLLWFETTKDARRLKDPRVDRACAILEERERYGQLVKQGKAPSVWKESEKRARRERYEYEAIKNAGKPRNYKEERNNK
jgi:hypothetical protein